MASENFGNEKLEIYIQYDFLTIEQYSKILGAVNNVYQSLTRTLIFGEFNYFNSQYIIAYPVPLCLEEVRTGDSINTKISFSGKFLPEIKIENNETINIILPKWSAVLILSSLILTYGIDEYKDYLDLRIKQLELKEKVREEVKAQSDQLNKIISQPDNPTAPIILQNIYFFNSEIYQSNIKEVQINNYIIHQKK